MARSRVNANQPNLIDGVPIGGVTPAAGAFTTVRTNTILDAAGGNTATINGIAPALASQAEAEAGTDNTKLMTPLRVEQHMLINAVGWGQAWQAPSRVVNTSYQNTTGRPIMVNYLGATGCVLQASVDNVTWVSLTNSGLTAGCGIIPPNHFYRFSGGSLTSVAELR